MLHNLVARHRESSLKPTRNLPPWSPAFEELEDAMQSGRGENASMVSLKTAPCMLQYSHAE